MVEEKQEGAYFTPPPPGKIGLNKMDFKKKELMTASFEAFLLATREDFKLRILLPGFPHFFMCIFPGLFKVKIKIFQDCNLW